MNFDDLNERLVPATDKLPQSGACSDADYAAGHPGACPNETRLVLKPEQVTRCGYGGVIKFETFLSAYNTETRQTSGISYASDNESVVVVNGGGVATIIGAGVATVSVSDGTRVAHSKVTILSGDTCCADIGVVTALAIDTSRSMGQAFGDDYPTKLYVAKELARRYVGAMDTTKDKASVWTFDNVAQEHQTPTDDAVVLASTVAGLGETGLGLTDLRSAVVDAIDLLRQTTADRRVLIVCSDGEQRPLMGIQEYERFQAEVQAFKDSGGIVIACGVRAKSDGYVLLRNVASAGFFLNVWGSGSMQAAVDYLLASMGYFCAADPLAGGYGYGYLDVAQVPDSTPQDEVELFDRSAG